MENKDKNTGKKKKVIKKKSEDDSITELKNKIKHQRGALNKIIKNYSK